VPKKTSGDEAGALSSREKNGKTSNPHHLNDSAKRSLTRRKSQKVSELQFTTVLETEKTTAIIVILCANPALWGEKTSRV